MQYVGQESGSPGTGRLWRRPPAWRARRSWGTRPVPVDCRSAANKLNNIYFCTVNCLIQQFSRFPSKCQPSLPYHKCKAAVPGHWSGWSWKVHYDTLHNPSYWISVVIQANCWNLLTSLNKHFIVPIFLLVEYLLTSQSKIVTIVFFLLGLVKRYSTVTPYV